MTDEPINAEQATTVNGDPAESPAAEKDPSDWVSGDEPMTAPQASYLKTLSQEAGQSYDPSMTKAAASERIDELLAKSDKRGQD